LGVGGGEVLPVAGNWPPVAPAATGLLGAALRADLGASWVIAAAKSLPPLLGAEESAGAAPPACAASLACAAPLLIGAREITGIAFIPREIASDVPSEGPSPRDMP
ncbi:MAG: hypothetical protein WBF21_14850, partial [Steroidobacteraceae bacterium]